jgi:hypothetical protein
LLLIGPCVVAIILYAPFFWQNPGGAFVGCPGGGGKGGGAVLLAEYKGQKFKYNDLVDVIVGTGVDVPGK